MNLRYILMGSAVLLLFLAGLFIYMATLVAPGSSDFSARLAGNYYLHRNSSRQILIAPNSWDDKTPVIGSKVVECDSDARFIIAKRQGMKRRSSGLSGEIFEEPDPDVFDYWILDTSIPKVIGPLKLDEFNAGRKKFGVPISLILKNVYSFKP